MNNGSFRAQLLAKKQPIATREDVPIGDLESYVADSITVTGSFIVTDPLSGRSYPTLDTAVEAVSPQAGHQYLELQSAEILPETAELKLTYVLRGGEFELSRSVRERLGEEEADNLESWVNQDYEPARPRLVLTGNFVAFIERADENSYAARIRRSIRKTGITLSVLEIADAWRTEKVLVRAGKPTAKVITYKPEIAF